MTFNNAFTAVILAVGCTTLAVARPPPTLFDVQIELLAEKATLCINTDNASSPHCEDFRSYDDYLAKGNHAVWIEYHMKNGDVNNRNANRVSLAIKLALQAMQMGPGQ